MNIKCIRVMKGNKGTEKQLELLFRQNGQLSIKQTATQTNSKINLNSLDKLNIEMAKAFNRELEGVSFTQDTGIHIWISNPHIVAPINRITHISCDSSNSTINFKIANDRFQPYSALFEVFICILKEYINEINDKKDIIRVDFSKLPLVIKALNDVVKYFNEGKLLLVHHLGDYSKIKTKKKFKDYTVFSKIFFPKTNYIIQSEDNCELFLNNEKYAITKDYKKLLLESLVKDANMNNLGKIMDI